RLIRCIKMRTRRPSKSSSLRRSKMRTRVAASVTGAITLFLASCDGTEPGDPDPAGSGSPSPGSEATESSSHAKYGAPSVADPLEVQGIISHPCSALTKDQLSNFPGTLDGDTHTTETTLYSDKKTSCNWSFQGDRYSLGGFVAGVALPHDRFHGLSSLYRANKKNKYKTFHPIETAGYPAV